MAGFLLAGQSRWQTCASSDLTGQVLGKCNITRSLYRLTRKAILNSERMTVLG